MKFVTVVDYGLGNLFNLVTALRVVGAEVKVTDDPGEVARSGRVILPGVGAFGPGMDVLRAKALDEAIREVRRSGRPLLGICLEMQFLMTESEEHGLHRGFDFIPGRVRLFEATRGGERVCKVPQISWNRLEPNSAAPALWEQSVLRGTPSGVEMYFVHSYYVQTGDPHHTIATTEYGGQTYASVVGHENVCGVQFHPERSAASGLKLLQNFLETK